jgi:hypothetical protein
VTVVRVKGRISKWVSKSRGREQLSIEWELGIGDDGYVGGEVTYDTFRDPFGNSSLHPDYRHFTCPIPPLCVVGLDR